MITRVGYCNDYGSILEHGLEEEFNDVDWDECEIEDILDDEIFDAKDEDYTHYVVVYVDPQLRKVTVI